MPRFGKPTQAARAAALLALGALAVHELRYLFAYGADAQAQMASQGHGYLGELTPALIVLALSVIGGRLVGAAFGSMRTEAAIPAGSPLRFAAALAAIFCAQELAEGAVFAGHPAGFAAIFAGGGWVALPLALLIGWICARAERLLDVTERVLARAARRRARHPRPETSLLPTHAPPACLAMRPLAFGLARRPPPAPSVF